MRWIFVLGALVCVRSIDEEVVPYNILLFSGDDFQVEDDTFSLHPSTDGITPFVIETFKTTMDLDDGILSLTLSLSDHSVPSLSRILPSFGFSPLKPSLHMSYEIAEEDYNESDIDIARICTFLMKTLPSIHWLPCSGDQSKDAVTVDLSRAAISNHLAGSAFGIRDLNEIINKAPRKETRRGNIVTRYLELTSLAVNDIRSMIRSTTTLFRLPCRDKDGVGSAVGLSFRADGVLLVTSVTRSDTGSVLNIRVKSDSTEVYLIRKPVLDHDGFESIQLARYCLDNDNKLTHTSMHEARTGSGSPWISNVVVNITGQGLHQTLNIDVVFQTFIVSNHDIATKPGGRGANLCNLAYLITLSSDEYVDVDELKSLASWGDPQPFPFTKYIDIERPSSVSRQHSVLLVRPVNLTLSTLDENHYSLYGRAADRIPIHLRYQNPQSAALEYAPVNLLPPRLYVSCYQGVGLDQNLQFRKVVEDFILSVPPVRPLDGTVTFPITIRDFASNLFTQMPVAMAEHKKVVFYLTFGVTIGATCLLTYVIYNAKGVDQSNNNKQD